MCTGVPAMKKDLGKEHIERVFSKLLSDLGSPVEFELPDYIKKERPSAYTYIRRNAYVTKRLKQKRSQDDGIFCSCNLSIVCGKDCHCGMLRSCCKLSCNCGPSCLNKPFQQRPVKKMKLVKTEKCGSGLVADEDIKEQEFVIEYVGEVIDDKTCEERLWKMKHSGETNFYLCEISSNMVIDATHKGNKSRYINHSCQPNTELQKWIIEGETRVGIFATRDIKKGEQLSYDYQFVQFGADQECHCGAPICRQKLGAKPSKNKSSSSDAVGKRKETFSDRHAFDHSNGRFHLGACHLGRYGKRQYRCNCVGEVIRMLHPADKRGFVHIKQFDKKTGKHKILHEDGSCEIIDLTEVNWESC